MVIIKFVLLILTFSLIAFFLNCLFPSVYLCPKFTKWTFLHFPYFYLCQKFTKWTFLEYIYRLNPCIFNLSLIKYPWLFIFFKLNLLGYLCPKFTKWTILHFGHFAQIFRFYHFHYFHFWKLLETFVIYIEYIPWFLFFFK